MNAIDGGEGTGKSAENGQQCSRGHGKKNGVKMSIAYWMRQFLTRLLPETLAMVGGWKIGRPLPGTDLTTRKTLENRRRSVSSVEIQVRQKCGVKMGRTHLIVPVPSQR